VDDGRETVGERALIAGRSQMDDGLLKGVLYQHALVYARRLWHYKWLSIGVAWLVCVIGWPVVSLIPPKYESSARVYISADQYLTPLLKGLATDVDPHRQVEYLQRTLLSRPNLQQVIHLSNLDISPRGRLSDADREQMLLDLAKSVALTAQGPNLVKITYQNSNPTTAKDVVQSLLTVFAETTTGSNRRDMENAKRFLDQQIETYATQLRAAEQRRADFREKYLQLLPGTDGAASNLEKGRSNLAKLKLEAEDARAKRDAVKAELDTAPKFLHVDSTAPQVIIGNGKPVGARARLAEANGRLQDLSLRFTSVHPDIIAQRRQITMLEEQVKKEPANGSDPESRKSEIANPVYDKVKLSLVDAEMVLASAERRLKQAEKEQEVLEETARAMPGIQAQAQDLDRDYAVKKKNFEELLVRREQARLGEAADTTADKIQFRVIDPPQVPVVPSAPNQPLLLSGVLVGAIGAAIGLPLLLFQFDRSYTTLTGLRALGVPVLGSVSHLVFPDGQRRERIQLAAVCASIAGLLCVYGLLLAISANMYRLSIV
jgi:polysaccharide chain length determinant protein (PEP-CTERM system associated)